MRKGDVTVRAARAHFRTIAWQPADFHLLSHTHLGNQLPEQQNTLPAKTGNLDGLGASMLPPRMALFFSDPLAGNAEQLRHAFLRHRDRRKVLLAISKYAKRKLLGESFRHPATSHCRLHLQDRRTGRKDLDHGESSALLLEFQRLFHRPASLDDVLAVTEGYALHIDRRFEGRDQLGDFDG